MRFAVGFFTTAGLPDIMHEAIVSFESFHRRCKLAAIRATARRGGQLRFGGRRAPDVHPSTLRLSDRTRTVRAEEDDPRKRWACKSLRGRVVDPLRSSHRGIRSTPLSRTPTFVRGSVVRRITKDLGERHGTEERDSHGSCLPTVLVRWIPSSIWIGNRRSTSKIESRRRARVPDGNLACGEGLRVETKE